jgi:hypothetical protein
MTVRSTAGLAAVAMLVGTLACASNPAPGEDETAAAQDTSEAQNPAGYRGMEQDTSQVSPDSQATPVDTFLQQQGTGVPADTAGYGGFEQPDTTGAAGQAGQDTSTTGWTDTTTTTGVDTSGMGMDTSGMTGATDTSGWSTDTSGMGTTDTTGQQ